MSERSTNLWRWHLRDLPRRRPSWFLSSQMVPLLFWGLFNGLRSFEPGWIAASAVLLLPVVCAGSAAFAILRRLRRKGTGRRHLLRAGVLASSCYYAVAGVVTSIYMLGMALEATAQLPSEASAARGILVVAYCVSALLAFFFSPHTLVQSEGEVRQSEERHSRWFPWALGCQAALVGSGVFLGSWLLHGEAAWGGLLVGGMAALGGLILVTMSMIGLHRFILLLASAMPNGPSGGVPSTPA